MFQAVFFVLSLSLYRGTDCGPSCGSGEPELHQNGDKAIKAIIVPILAQFRGAEMAKRAQEATTEGGES